MSKASKDWVTEAQRARKEAFETHRVAMKMESERLQRRLDELAEFYAPRIAIQDAGGTEVRRDRRAGAQCFCGDSTRPDVGHRSHECLPIGLQPGGTEGGAND